MRALVAVVVAVIMVASGGSSSATGDLLSLTNADRSRYGLSSLTIVADLQAYAQGWAEAMMSAGQLSHSPDLDPVSNLRVVGENVGQGPTLTDIESAFMASPAHRANILWPDYSEAGVGVVWDGDEFYVAVVFRQATTAAAPPAAPVEPDPAPVLAEPGPPSVVERKSAPAAAPAAAPAPSAPSSPPATRLPEPTPARFAAMSAPAEVPPPLPSPEPAGAEPASVVPEAGPRLSWVLAATTGKPVSAADGHDGASPAPAMRTASLGSAAEDGSSPALLVTVAVLWMVYAWTRILAEAHQWFVSRSGRPTVERHH